jgi:hypothetical protein
MSVLFPTPAGYTLKANKPAELLQGFLNIQNVENVTNGQLNKANLDSYSQKQFFAADPSSEIAGYFKQNFEAIARLDGNANSISTDDLVQIRQGLPSPPPPVTNPPNPPANNPHTQVLQLILQLLQLLLGGLMPSTSNS